MEIIGLLLLFGLAKGVEYAAKYAAHDGKIGASAAWRKAGNPPVTRSARLGWFAGRTVSAGWHGTKHGANGLARGWSAGWPVGKQIAQERYERRRIITTPDGATVTPIPGSRPAPEATRKRPDGIPVAIPSRTSLYGQAAPDEPARKGAWTIRFDWPGEVVKEPFDNDHPEQIAVWSGAELAARKAGLDRMVANGELVGYQVEEYDPDADRARREQEQVTQDDQPEGLATATPISGGTTMPITTVTGGEVTTYASLIAELEAAEKEAVADLEDATADYQRAKENHTRFETMQAALATLKLDEKTLGEIAALGESSTARMQASEARQRAAEQTAMLAETARRGVQERHSAIQEHANVMAERQFYAG